MKISVITVVFNNRYTIKSAIQSVLNQDYPDIEYIIIDGGSTDGTLDIINHYRNKIHHIISEPDGGIYDAMNKGIKLATGDLVATLNSDDVYADNTIVRQMVNFIETNNLDAAYGDLVYTDPKDSERITRTWTAGPYTKNAFRYGWVPPHPTFFCRKSAFDRYGHLRNDFRIAADFELMLRFIEKNKINVGYLPKTVVKMRGGGKANRLSGVIRGNWEILKSFQLNGFSVSPLFFISKPITKLSQIFVRTK